MQFVHLSVVPARSCSLSLFVFLYAGMLAFPAFSLFLSHLYFVSFFFEICSIPWCVLLVLSFIYFYTRFRSFFCCVRARCLERIYIYYILHSCECVLQVTYILEGKTRSSIAHHFRGMSRQKLGAYPYRKDLKYMGRSKVHDVQQLAVKNAEC